MAEIDCTLDYKNRSCGRINCAACGWNAEVAAQRSEYIKQHRQPGLPLPQKKMPPPELVLPRAAE